MWVCIIHQVEYGLQCLDFGFWKVGHDIVSCVSLDITRSHVQLSEFWGIQNLKLRADLGGSQIKCEVRDLDLVVLLRSCATNKK